MDKQIFFDSYFRKPYTFPYTHTHILKGTHYFSMSQTICIGLGSLPFFLLLTNFDFHIYYLHENNIASLSTVRSSLISTFRSVFSFWVALFAGSFFFWNSNKEVGAHKHSYKTLNFIDVAPKTFFSICFFQKVFLYVCLGTVYVLYKFGIFFSFVKIKILNFFRKWTFCKFLKSWRNIQLALNIKYSATNIKVGHEIVYSNSPTL